MELSNTLAYYDTAATMAEKSFIVQALWPVLLKFYNRNL
jgi:hypothetical protein